MCPGQQLEILDVPAYQTPPLLLSPSCPPTPPQHDLFKVEPCLLLEEQNLLLILAGSLPGFWRLCPGLRGQQQALENFEGKHAALFVAAEVMCAVCAVLLQEALHLGLYKNLLHSVWGVQRLT